MTAKEKAIYLVNKFSSIGLQQRGECIICALIAVDEILDTIKGLVFGVEYLYNSAYWEEVRKEIENQ